MFYHVDPARVLYRFVDGEAVLISADTSYYYSLNGVGTFIWKLLTEKGRTTTELLEAIRVEYSPPMDQAARDLDNLLNELRTEGLVITEEK